MTSALSGIELANSSDPNERNTMAMLLQSHRVKGDSRYDAKHEDNFLEGDEADWGPRFEWSSRFAPSWAPEPTEPEPV